MKKNIRKNLAIAITKKIKKEETAETNNKEQGQLMFFVPGKTLVYDVKLPTPKVRNQNQKQNQKWKNKLKT